MVPQRVRKRPTARRRAVHALSLGGEAQDGGRPREGLLVVAHAEDRSAERGAELRPDELCGLELVLRWYINCEFALTFSYLWWMYDADCCVLGVGCCDRSFVRTAADAVRKHFQTHIHIQIQFGNRKERD